MARRRFFVDAFHGGKAQICGDEAHHLARVLRVEPGQQFELSNNECVWLGEVETVRKDLVGFLLLEALPSRQALVRVTLYASLIRFERFELLLEKATELGVERVVPVIAERSEKGLDKAVPKRMARWMRLVREASEQSRRTRLPEIEGPCRLPGELPHLALLLDEDAGAPPILRAALQGEVAVIVGPEGGWTDRERAALIANRWQPVSLGIDILRAETAAIAALAILNAAALAPQKLRDGDEVRTIG
jgi:16S rRNA (uracil1498-N3)-methyltransferase